MMITARTDPKSAAELWRCKLRLMCVQMLGARRQQHDGSRCPIPARRRSSQTTGGHIHGNITCAESAVLNSSIDSMEAAAEAVCVWQLVWSVRIEKDASLEDLVRTCLEQAVLNPWSCCYLIDLLAFDRRLRSTYPRMKRKRWETIHEYTRNGRHLTLADREAR